MSICVSRIGEAVIHNSPAHEHCGYLSELLPDVSVFEDSPIKTPSCESHGRAAKHVPGDIAEWLVRQQAPTNLFFSEPVKHGLFRLWYTEGTQWTCIFLTQCDLLSSTVVACYQLRRG